LLQFYDLEICGDFSFELRYLLIGMAHTPQTGPTFIDTVEMCSGCYHRRSRFQSSTKVEALREELELMRAADPGAKAIVFSQFTSMLELIGFRLEQVRVEPFC
jgi:SNF2 family DNA or RNA helicase